jgi:hypothetical protein
VTHHPQITDHRDGGQWSDPAGSASLCVCVCFLQWKAYRNEGHVSVDFRVRVFLSNDDDFAVEFQKRKVLILILSISNLS